MALTKTVVHQFVQWLRRGFQDALGINIPGVVIVDANGNQIVPLGVGGTVNVSLVSIATVDGQQTMALSLPVVLASNQSPVDTDVVSIALPTVLYNGVQEVSAAGTAEALAGSQALVSGVKIKAYQSNTDLVYVGGSGVSAANGYQLASGESVFIEIDDLASVYVDAVVNDEGVSFVGS